MEEEIKNVDDKKGKGQKRKEIKEERHRMMDEQLRKGGNGHGDI